MLTKKCRNSKSGFTFIEMMVTLLIFSTGIVAVLKTFLISLDRINYINKQLYAHVILEDRLAIVERKLRSEHVLPFNTVYKDSFRVGSRLVDYDQFMDIREVGEFVDLFRLNLKLSWKEGDHSVEVSRTAFISDFSLPNP